MEKKKPIKRMSADEAMKYTLEKHKELLKYLSKRKIHEHY